MSAPGAWWQFERLRARLSADLWCWRWTPHGWAPEWSPEDATEAGW